MTTEVGFALTTADDVISVLNLARRIERNLAVVLAEDDLRVDHWRILHALSVTPGSLMGELADELAIPSASVTRFVDELSDKGLVFRRPAPDDRRKAGVYLSRLGSERLARALSIVEARGLGLMNTDNATLRGRD